VRLTPFKVFGLPRFMHMGLGDHVVSIEDFLISPESVLEKTKNILNNYDYHQKKNNEAVAAAIQLNASVMKDIFN